MKRARKVSLSLEDKLKRLELKKQQLELQKKIRDLKTEFKKGNN